MKYQNSQKPVMCGKNIYQQPKSFEESIEGSVEKGSIIFYLNKKKMNWIKVTHCLLAKLYQKMKKISAY